MQAEVLVNSTNKELKLDMGYISKSLLQAAGPSLQLECSEKAPDGVQPGNIVITGGGKLPCAMVFHGACVAWETDKKQAARVRIDLAYCK